MDSDFSFHSQSHSQQGYAENTKGKEMEEKRKNTMSVELAIQRELAYRRKIENLQLQPYVGFGDKSLQVQFPSQSHSRPNLNSNPRLSGREQLASLSNHECLPTPRLSQNPSSRPNSCSGPRISEIKHLASSSKSPPEELLPLMVCNIDNPFCVICQVPCSGSLNYNQHINGKRHKAKLQELKFGRKDGDDTGSMANLRPRCKLCNIWCSDDNLLKQHLAGQKHKKMQEKLGRSTSVEGAILEQQNWCGLCRIGCSSKELLQYHFNGKKHQAELRKQEYAQKGDEEAQNKPKRCKQCNTLCADKSSLQVHLREKNHFLSELEGKKRQWIRDINIEGSS